MLWVAVACMQREEKDGVFVVYTGDVGEEEGKATKEEILDKVKVRLVLFTAETSRSERRETPERVEGFTRSLRGLFFSLPCRPSKRRTTPSAQLTLFPSHTEPLRHHPFPF